jgi:hypothetical protein
MTALIISYLKFIASEVISAEQRSQATQELQRLLRDLNDAEIASIVVELSIKYPQFSQSQWYNMLNSAKYYGLDIYLPNNANNGGHDKSHDKADDKGNNGYATYFIIGVAALILLRGRRK